MSTSHPELLLETHWCLVEGSRLKLEIGGGAYPDPRQETGEGTQRGDMEEYTEGGVGVGEPRGGKRDGLQIHRDRVG